MLKNALNVIVRLYGFQQHHFGMIYIFNNGIIHLAIVVVELALVQCQSSERCVAALVSWQYQTS